MVYSKVTVVKNMIFYIRVRTILVCKLISSKYGAFSYIFSQLVNM